MIKENDILVCRKDYIKTYYYGRVFLFKKNRQYKISRINNNSFWYDPGKHKPHQYVSNYNIYIESEDNKNSMIFISAKYSRNYRSEDYIWDYFYPLSYWRKMKLKKLNDGRNQREKKT